jgi:hypothetical protein
VMRTPELLRGRCLTCGARSSVIAEAKYGLSTHKAPCALPPGKGLALLLQETPTHLLLLISSTGLP